MKNKQLSLWLVVTLAVMGIMCLANRYKRVAIISSLWRSGNAAPDSEITPVGPVRQIRFTLFEQGIRPAELRIQACLANVAIEDRTTTGNGVLIDRVEAGQHTEVGRLQNLANTSRGRKLVRFTPGTYELSDVARPANKAVLLVEP